MSANSEAIGTGGDGVFEVEQIVLRRLKRLAESEDERTALRACELLLRYVREHRRAEARQAAEPPRAKTEAKPAVPAPAPKVAIPKGLIERTAPKPAFRAVPFDKLAELNALRSS